MRTILAILVLAALAPLIHAQPKEREFDIVVYGGTSGGISAAIQAARMGKSVALIEPGNHLGGLSSGGLGATDIGNREVDGYVIIDAVQWLLEK
jgi:ribulose 1,5-bisphosphate synthetase/thiazole synthase